LQRDIRNVGKTLANASVLSNGEVGRLNGVRLIGAIPTVCVASRLLRQAFRR